MKDNFSEENHIINELLEIIEDTKTLQNVSTDEVYEMLNFMCTA